MKIAEGRARICVSSVSAEFVSVKWLSTVKFPASSRQAGKEKRKRIMQTTDPIADYLTRLRNAIQAKHKRVDIPASNLKKELSKILTDQKFISGFSEIKDQKQGVLRVNLRYTDGVSAIAGLKRISRPGLRVYKPANELPRVYNGLGIAVISTSKGIMTEKNAREQKVGGEVLCEIW